MFATRQSLLRSAIVLMSLAVSYGAASAQTPSATPPPGPVQSTTITGTVDSYNLNAEGVPNSLTIKDGDRVSQFNLPADTAATLAGSAAVGQKVTAIGIPQLLVGDHAIFKLVSLAVGDGKPMTADSMNSWQILHVEGTIKQLNFASKGEVDGVVLDTGDFLHTGRATAATVYFAIGQKLTADGWGHAIPGGHNVIEPTKLNDRAVKGPDHPTKTTAAAKPHEQNASPNGRTGRNENHTGPMMGRGMFNLREGDHRQPPMGRPGMQGMQRRGWRGDFSNERSRDRNEYQDDGDHRDGMHNMREGEHGQPPMGRPGMQGMQRRGWPGGFLNERSRRGNEHQSDGDHRDRMRNMREGDHRQPPMGRPGMQGMQHRGWSDGFSKTNRRPGADGRSDGDRRNGTHSMKEGDRHPSPMSRPRTQRWGGEMAGHEHQKWGDFNGAGRHDAREEKSDTDHRDGMHSNDGRQLKDREGKASADDRRHNNDGRTDVDPRHGWQRGNQKDAGSSHRDQSSKNHEAKSETKQPGSAKHEDNDDEEHHGSPKAHDRDDE